MEQRDSQNNGILWFDQVWSNLKFFKSIMAFLKVRNECLLISTLLST